MSAIDTAASSPSWRQIPAVADLIADADHIDLKHFEGNVSLRQFLAGIFSYYPGWIKTLYRIRWLFVRLLGMTQKGVPQSHRLKPEEISMTPGDKTSFFEVKAAQEEHFYITGATESHLTAHLVVIRETVIHEPRQGDRNRFTIITVVHYHRWTGRLYFNVIRPFHHLVVEQMGRAGVAFLKGTDP